MFVTLIILAIGAAVILAMRTRIAQLERRIEIVEDSLTWRAGEEAARMQSESTFVPVGEPVPPVPDPVPVPVKDTVLRIRGRAETRLDAERPARTFGRGDKEVVLEAQLPPRPHFGFEDLFGRKLSIWAGGVTLAVAGMLIVKYSIDIGLLSPLVRVINGLLFGCGLIVAAELARKKEHWTRDPRVPQALAGAGIATLYGSVLVAANVYDLIGPFPALVGMALVTGLAMLLSTRLGAPSALLGLVGGLAAPALVGSGDPNIPLLSLYLALAVGGLCAVSRSQRWLWLGIGALAGGFLWGGLLILGGNLDPSASISIGTYLIMLGVLLPIMVFSGDGRAQLRVGGALVAAAQMAALVAAGGFTMLHWGLFGLISVAVIWLSRREKDLAILPTLGFAIGLLLTIVWPDPPVGHLAVALGGLLIIYGIPAFVSLWGGKGSIVEAAQLAAAGLAAALVPVLHFYHGQAGLDIRFALLAFGAALIPGAAAALGTNHSARLDDSRFALLTTTSAVLLAVAALFALPAWAEGPAVVLLGLGLLLASLGSRDLRIERSAWTFLAAALGLLIFHVGTPVELFRMVGANGLTTTDYSLSDPALAFVRWFTLGTIAGLFAWRATFAPGRQVAQAIAVVLTYGAVAQVAAPGIVPLIPAVALAAAAYWQSRLREGAVIPALAMLVALVVAWALAPLAHWSGAALLSITGAPVFVTDLPTAETAFLRLLLPALLIAISLWLARNRVLDQARHAAAVICGSMAGAAAHILFKQLLALDSETAFVARGLVERSLWEALLLGCATAAWSVSDRFVAARPAARALCAAALAHCAYYSILFHNPLWAEQAVGAVSLFNLLLIAYGLPLAAIWCIQRYEPAFAMDWRPARDVAQMGLVLLVAFSLLRQLFHGSILVVPGVTDAEDILRSVLAIALAIAFLVQGIAQGSRQWRVGSLILMLAAVGKVFLLDASGLEGLPRILSFVALGFSLIGIGWLYSRYLADERPPIQGR
jgi:uncharacterized membrane protein